MKTEIHHIGIAVKSLRESVPIYISLLGLEPEYKELPDRGVKTATFCMSTCSIELLEPKGQDTPVGKFLNKHGPGLHHVAFNVHDISSTKSKIERLGVKEIESEKGIGVHNLKIAFLHPKTTGGVLIELLEEKIVNNE
jgi:methylmalonyl-CoA/ethylmalonyl-CoA epimerase